MPKHAEPMYDPDLDAPLPRSSSGKAVVRGEDGSNTPVGKPGDPPPIGDPLASLGLADVIGVGLYFGFLLATALVLVMRPSLNLAVGSTIFLVAVPIAWRMRHRLAPWWGENVSDEPRRAAREFDRRREPTSTAREILNGLYRRYIYGIVAVNVSTGES